jgi:hypothetical protein
MNQMKGISIEVMIDGNPKVVVLRQRKGYVEVIGDLIKNQRYEISLTDTEKEIIKELRKYNERRSNLKIRKYYGEDQILHYIKENKIPNTLSV